MKIVRTVILIDGNEAYASSDSGRVITCWKKNLESYSGGVNVIREPEADGTGRMVIKVRQDWAMRSAKFLIPKERDPVSQAEAERIVTELDSISIPDV